VVTDITIETVVVPRIGGTPYAGFAIRAHAALIEEGLSSPDEALVANHHSAVVARLATGEAVGVVTFSAIETNNTIFAWLAFVVPDFRRRGVYRLMHEELVKAAERLGAVGIEAISVAGNVAFNRTATSSGMRVVAQVYRPSPVAELSPKLRSVGASDGFRRVSYWCPGCRHAHVLPVALRIAGAGQDARIERWGVHITIPGPGPGTLEFAGQHVQMPDWPRRED
jgi:GNAT superfamily N-acetyltransferase